MSNPAYIGVDPTSPLGQLITEVDALVVNFATHLADPDAHAAISADIDALQAQLDALTAQLNTAVANYNNHLNPAIDPHPQYVNYARGDVRYAPLAHSHAKYALSASLNEHIFTAPNPHPQYITMPALNNFFYGAGFQSMAYQASNNVNITGGIITGVDIEGYTTLSTWRTGPGIPPNNLGIENDLWLSTDTGNVYQKENGVYVLKANIRGPAGASGFSGQPGGQSGFSGFSGRVTGYDAISTTTNTIGFVSKTFTVPAGLAYVQGGRIRVTATADATGNTYMEGFIATYVGGTTLIMQPMYVSGSGSFSNWSLSVVGSSGFSGYSSGSGFSGMSGFSGYSGASGLSGASGPGSGFSGYSGNSGFSGYSGRSGFSGDSGFSGRSGFSGVNAPSGYSGFSGGSGFSGTNAPSGFSGFSGASGPGSGFSGFSGTSGFSSKSGFSGFSSMSGFSGHSGFSGYSSSSGFSGFSSTSGFSGFSGASGPGSGFSGYSGTNAGSGFSGYSGASGLGFQGVSGFSGFSGTNAPSGFSGFSGASGPGSGFSGYSGASGFSGISGRSGNPGNVGPSGYSGFSGGSGFSGAGQSGYSGFSGKSGFSGRSGFSGASGFSGTRGFSGYSGAVGSPWGPTVNHQTGTTYTIQASDMGNVITLDNTSSIVVTVPLGLGPNFATTLIQINTGPVTVSAASLVQVKSRNSFLNLSGYQARAELFAYSADVFNLAGDLA